MAPSSPTATDLLLRWSAGDRACLDELILLLNRELHRMAHRLMRSERQGHTLCTTALLNEAYLKLVARSDVAAVNRAQFFGLAAREMRRILVDHARGHRRGKRGGGAFQIPFDEEFVFSPARSALLIALDDALADLAGLYPRKAQVVELRYFGGLSVEEAAAVLRLHPNTVIRDWTFAKAWLNRELSRNSVDTKQVGKDTYGDP